MFSPVNQMENQKNPNAMKLIKLLAIFCITMSTVASYGQIKTYVLTETNGTQQIDIKSNEVVQVLFHYNIERFKFIVDGVTNRFWIGDLGSEVGELKLPIIAGPATMIVDTDNTGSFHDGIFTIKKSVQSDTLNPTAAVVIPSDAIGPANVLLESSTNLVTWTGALPGTYGRSAQTRFFRVRAELLP